MRCWLTLCVVLSPLVAAAQASFSLSEAREKMLQTHPLLASVNALAAAARSDAVETGLWTNPQLNVSYANAWRSSYAPVGLFNASLSQFLELSGTPSARARAGALLAAASEADVAGIRLELSLLLAEAALRYEAARQRVLVQRARTVQLAEVVRIIKERFAAGAAPQYDADRIGIEFGGAEADLGDAEADLLRARGALRAAIGPAASTLPGELEFDLQAQEKLPALEQLLEVLHRDRPDVKGWLARAEASEAQIDAARKAVFPGVGIAVGTQYGQSAMQLDLNVGFSVPLPVINRGQGAIPAARARAESSRAVLASVLGPAEQLLAGVRDEVQRRRATLAGYQARSLTSSDSMLREARLTYESGKSSVLEFADAYSAWADARMHLVTLAQDTRQAEIDLSRLVGRSFAEGRTP